MHLLFHRAAAEAASTNWIVRAMVASLVLAALSARASVIQDVDDAPLRMSSALLSKGVSHQDSIDAPAADPASKAPLIIANASALAVAPEAEKAEVRAVEPSSAPQELVGSVMNWSLLKEQRSLRAALQRWAQVAGWTLVWEIPFDPVLEADATFRGTFEAAVSDVLTSTWAANYQMRAVLYRGNKVLRVAPLGERS